MIRRLLAWLKRPRHCYVVIYDHGGWVGDVIEEYYGYFCTPEEALHMYGELSAGRPDYHNARLCKVVQIIPDMEPAL